MTPAYGSAVNPRYIPVGGLLPRISTNSLSSLGLDCTLFSNNDAYGGPGNNRVAIQVIGAFTGTSLDGKIQESNDNGNWSDAAGGAFTTVSASNNLQVIIYQSSALYNRYVGIFDGVSESLSVQMADANFVTATSTVVAMVQPQIITSTVTGGTIDYNAAPPMRRCLVVVGTVGGTGPTIDGKIQESSNGSDWSDVVGGKFPRITGSDRTQHLTYYSTLRYNRFVGTIGGGNPSFAIMVLGIYDATNPDVQGDVTGLMP